MQDNSASLLPPPREYWCFLSYRHADNKAEGRQWASWLHHSIETYEVPPELVGKTNDRGDVIPERLFPIFRDEEELPADAELSRPIEQALQNSRFLVVLSSPKSVASPYVNGEIRRFRELRHSNKDRLLAAIIAGDPAGPIATEIANETVPYEKQQCFPPALREPSVGEDGSATVAEPIAADFRLTDGSEGFTNPTAYRQHLKNTQPGLTKNAIESAVDAFNARMNLMKLKIVAGILGVPVGYLTDRDKAFQLTKAKERARRFRIIAAVMGVLLLFSLAAAAWAYTQQKKAETQLEYSQLEEGRAWLERARTAEQEGDHLKAYLLAGRAVGYTGYGRKEKETPELEKAYPLLLGRNFNDPEAERQRLEEQASVGYFIRGMTPTGLLIWSSPVQAQHSQVVNDVAYSPDGKRLVSVSRDKNFKIWDSVTGDPITTFQVGTEEVTCVAFSPDGRSLICGSRDRTIRVCNAETGKIEMTLQAHSAPVTCIHLSRDGKLLGSASDDLSIKIWDMATGKEVSTLNGHRGGISSIAFSPDGKWLASGSSDRHLKIWDVATAKETPHSKVCEDPVYDVAFSPDGRRIAHTLSGGSIVISEVVGGKQIVTLRGHTDDVRSIHFSSDGKNLLSGSYDTTVKLWNVETGKEIATYKKHTQRVSCLAFSPDNQQIATGRWDGSVMTWSVESTQEKNASTGHTQSLTSVTFSPDGRLVASASYDNTVRLWNAATGDAAATVDISNGAYCVAFSPDGRRLAYGSVDGVIQLLDTATGGLISTLKEHTGAVASIAFSPDGKLLASGSYDCSIKLWHLGSDRNPTTFSEHHETVTSLAFSPDGTHLACGSSDRTVRLWILAPYQEKLLLKGHDGDIRGVTFSPDGKHLISAGGTTVKFWEVATGKETVSLAFDSNIKGISISPDGSRLACIAFGKIKMWDIKTQKEIFSIQGHIDSATCISFSPDNHKLVTGSEDKTVKLWDVAERASQKILKGHSDHVGETIFSPDGNRLASISSDKTVKLWSLETGREEATLLGHEAPAYRVVFSPNSQKLITSSGDKTARIWDVETGDELATLSGHTNQIFGLAISADGKRLATGSQDHTAKLWSADTGKELASFNGHTNWVNSVAFSHDGNLLATASSDATAKLWNIATGKEVKAFKSNFHTVTSVAFSPDSKRLAVAANVIHVWDTMTDDLLLTLQGDLGGVKEVTFTPDGKYILGRSYSPVASKWDAVTGERVTNGAITYWPSLIDRTGTFAVDSRDSLIYIKATHQPLDLLALDRQGYLRMDGRQIEWSSNPTLREPPSFRPLYWRPDLITELGEAKTDDQRFLIRLRLCSQNNTWRALIGTWEEMREVKADQNPELRHEFCVQAAVAARSLAVMENETEPYYLWRPLLETLQAGDWEDTHFTLPMAQAVPALLAKAEPNTTVADLVTERVPPLATRSWLEAVNAAISQKLKLPSLSGKARDALTAFRTASIAKHPDLKITE